MTSNLGADILVMQQDGEDSGAVRDEVMHVVRSHFRPEFLNRVDEIILFHRAAPGGHGGRSSTSSWRGSPSSWRTARSSSDLSPAARTWLADKGYDPAYGARPLKRVIQKAVQDQLAEKILAGDILDGSEVTIGVGPDGLIIGDLTVLPHAGAAPEPGSRAIH